jgi:hypothetical protein
MYLGTTFPLLYCQTGLLGVIEVPSGFQKCHDFAQHSGGAEREILISCTPSTRRQHTINEVHTRAT